MFGHPRRRNRRAPAFNGFVVAVGAAGRLGGITPYAIVVVGDHGHRCAVLTAVDHEELHRALVHGAENLRSTSARTAEPPFGESAVAGELVRHLPHGYRMGAPRHVELRDVHGTGRLHFADLIGGCALDDEVESRAGSTARSLGDGLG